MDMHTIQNFLSTTVTELAIKILAAIAFWIIGRWLIGKVVSLMQAGDAERQGPRAHALNASLSFWRLAGTSIVTHSPLATRLLDEQAAVTSAESRPTVSKPKIF